MLFAIGRKPVSASLDLHTSSIETTAAGHIAVDAASRTSCDGVYAVGDVIGKIDLTPVAIAAGRLLSDRLFNGAPLDETIMDYDMVPTVVFSHPPLAVMGLTEAEAIERYGAEQVTCHQTTFVNMLYSREFLFDGQDQPKTRAKLVCVGAEQRVIGVHMIGLAVDEILQAHAPLARRDLGAGGGAAMPPPPCYATAASHRPRPFSNFTALSPPRLTPTHAPGFAAAGLLGGAQDGRHQGRLRLGRRHPPHLVRGARHHPAVAGQVWQAARHAAERRGAGMRARLELQGRRTECTLEVRWKRRRPVTGLAASLGVRRSTGCSRCVACIGQEGDGGCRVAI